MATAIELGEGSRDLRGMGREHLCGTQLKREMGYEVQSEAKRAIIEKNGEAVTAL